MSEFRAKRKMRVLVLVEIRLQEGVEVGFDPEFGGLTLEGHGGKHAHGPAYVVAELQEALLARFPQTQYPNTLWYVKSVEEATAP